LSLSNLVDTLQMDTNHHNTDSFVPDQMHYSR
jgi:hypothetical protein